MLLVCKTTPFAASRRHPIPLQSLPQYHRPPSSMNLIRFINPNNLRLSSSRYGSLKCTAFNLKPLLNFEGFKGCTAFKLKPPKSDSDNEFHIQNHPSFRTLRIWIFIKKCAIGLVVMALLVMSDPVCSWAVSGGRMGGRAFRSSRSSSSYSSYAPSSSYSSYAPSSSSSSYSPLSSSSSFSSSPSLSSLMVVRRSYRSTPTPTATEGSHQPRGAIKPEAIESTNLGTFFVVLIPIVIIYYIVCVLDDNDFAAGACCVWDYIAYQIALAQSDREKTTVLKLQVGVFGTATSLQRELNRIAQTARTSTTKGLSHMLTETTLALMRHPDYCISAYSGVHFWRTINMGERQFDRLSIEERAKFSEETLVNVNNTVTHRPSTLLANELRNEYIVVTLLVAIQGYHMSMMPTTIKESEDLRNALRKLKSIPISQIRAVEVLWTPQVENDTLSENQLIEHYPHLVALQKH